MNILESLKCLLCLTSEADTDYLSKRFDMIAGMLFKNVAIRKGEDIFLFADVEFYFYNKHHKDIITHPRNCESMQWYVNDFGGIDLSFKSETKVERIVNDKKKLSIKPVLSNDSYFGGILIRELHNAETGERLEGPWACAELFRTHDALGTIDDYPVLLEYESAREIQDASPRLNLKRSNQKTEAKVKYLLSAYANKFSDDEIKELCESFDKYQGCLYRYRIK